MLVKKRPLYLSKIYFGDTWSGYEAKKTGRMRCSALVMKKFSHTKINFIFTIKKIDVQKIISKDVGVLLLRNYEHFKSISIKNTHYGEWGAKKMYGFTGGILSWKTYGNNALLRLNFFHTKVRIWANFELKNIQKNSNSKNKLKACQ